jgi:hypothetical protein
VKYPLLFVLPLAGAVTLGVWQSHTADPASLYRGWVLALKAIAAGGAAAAGLRFYAGDYLRAAWLLTALCYALLFSKDLLFGLGWRAMEPFPTTVAIVRGFITLAANLAGVLGALLLARAWRVAEILLPGTPRQRTLIVVLAAVLAFATAGHATLVDLKDLWDGNAQRLVSVASDVGDIVSLILIAPVLLTAIALRGGLLFWPWALMAASQLGWLLYDAATTITTLAHLDAARGRGLEEICRTLACLFAFTSGIAQRMVMTDMRRGHRA